MTSRNREFAAGKSLTKAKMQGGVTLLELLIVVLIAGVLAVIAAPSLQSVLRNTRMNSAAGQLVSDLNLARGEAIKRNARMLICARNADGNNCGTNWAAGWVVCQEGAANTCAATSAEAPNPIAVRAALDPSLTLSVANFDASIDDIRVVRFSPNSFQSSEKTAGTRDGCINITLGGNWSGATNRIARVEVTGATYLSSPQEPRPCPSS